jgi:cation diffusion facilitator CzcD-associated flavoprotein CzcO
MNGAPQRRGPAIAIVGGGFGGIGAAVRLREAGYTDITIFERGDRLGGVWFHNTYPGCACDVPSALYSFSFEPNPGWSRRFSPQPEIRAYLERVASEHGVDACARLGTEVLGAEWDDMRCKWVLATSDGRFEASVLVAACGQLTNPSVPPIPGLDTFAGPVMHTARWDAQVRFGGRRVAVIGTGASAVQVVPELAKVASHLDVFQIDAPWLLPKPNPPYRSWERRLFQRFPPAMALERELVFWLQEMATLAYTSRPHLRPLLRAISVAQRRRQVSDPELRRKVTPTDTIGCKRVLLSNDWYPALGQPHVDLVCDPIDRAEHDALVTATGAIHPADVIVLGTGFRAQQFVLPMTIAGRHGLTLSGAWAGRPKAHLGTTVPGFPNLFLLYGPNTNVGAGSVINALEAAIAQVLLGLGALERNSADTIEVTPEASAAFDAECQAALAQTVWATGCASWYVDANGENANNWPWTAREYRRRLGTLALDSFSLRDRLAPVPAFDREVG